MCSHTGSSSQLTPLQPLSNSQQGSLPIDKQWDFELQVAVARRGGSGERQCWKKLYEDAYKYAKSGHWSLAAANFQAACNALTVGTEADAGSNEPPHPYMIMPVLGLAYIVDKVNGGHNPLEVHRRLVLLCFRLMPLFAAWEELDAKQHRRDLQQIAREIAETKERLELAQQSLEPNQRFGPDTETSKKHVREIAEKLLNRLDEARKQDVPLSSLQTDPRMNE
ncbi:hypothetical protein [Hyalangium minutum]|uniref:hypothetical protein n=1 Tax=Hyalangium minutum TaxID=394096 RepID=UPI0012F8592D|nr:hypothetical protein [Hyalangium minutum]